MGRKEQRIKNKLEKNQIKEWIFASLYDTKWIFRTIKS